MYDLFSKSNFRIRPKKNFSLWSYLVKPILLFLKLKLVLGSRLVTALCDNDNCTWCRMERAGALGKGRAAWEGELNSPDMSMDSSFSPALPVLSLGCSASATTGFTSLSVIIIIKLCWVEVGQGMSYCKIVPPSYHCRRYSMLWISAHVNL